MLLKITLMNEFIEKIKLIILCKEKLGNYERTMIKISNNKYKYSTKNG